MSHLPLCAWRMAASFFGRLRESHGPRSLPSNPLRNAVVSDMRPLCAAVEIVALQ
jgi:hypothetical protein